MVDKRNQPRVCCVMSSFSPDICPGCPGRVNGSGAHLAVRLNICASVGGHLGGHQPGAVTDGVAVDLSPSVNRSALLFLTPGRDGGQAWVRPPLF